MVEGGVVIIFISSFTFHSILRISISQSLMNFSVFHRKKDDIGRLAVKPHLSFRDRETPLFEPILKTKTRHNQPSGTSSRDEKGRS